jgi:hypothetical protein
LKLFANVTSLRVESTESFNLRASSSTLVALTIKVDPDGGGSPDSYTLVGFTNLTTTFDPGSGPVSVLLDSGGDLKIEGLKSTSALTVSIETTDNDMILGGAQTDLASSSAAAVEVLSGNITLIASSGGSNEGDIVDESTGSVTNDDLASSSKFFNIITRPRGDGDSGRS